MILFDCFKGKIETIAYEAHINNKNNVIKIKKVVCEKVENPPILIELYENFKIVVKRARLTKRPEGNAFVPIYFAHVYKSNLVVMNANCSVSINPDGQLEYTIRINRKFIKNTTNTDSVITELVNVCKSYLN